MKSGGQPAHTPLRCRSSAVFLFLGHCPSFLRPSHFWGIAPAFPHSSVSGALPQLFCPFTFLGHCPSSSSLFRFWGNSTHAKKSEVLTSNVQMLNLHCLLVAAAPRPPYSISPRYQIYLSYSSQMQESTLFILNQTR